MNKQEKYINYIIEDLVKKTKVDYDEELISYPIPYLIEQPFYLFHLSHYPSPSIISRYLTDTYGTKEDEVKPIWKQYKERIQTLIKK